ncbi:quaternary amine ABC transporter ATP-binding protein [Rhodoligotrophos appendicifer]|uniref:quaternary amine ABC transporter ATP-binding protein n=1 Tax=Rhodoligotrophos appendicifer TaxID=987056 RepID=UPI00118587F9|nr:betaine/proline/choline family ABC transporter ATP-binding protein [Rhodoligotrophos appendicifer]
MEQVEAVEVPASPAIELRGVWKLFGDKASEAMSAIHRDGLTKSEVLQRYDCVVGVADANLTIARGEIFCVMGLSGSGKSTLVRHINRLLEPTSGEIYVDGEDMLGKKPAELRSMRARRIGMVFQNFGLLPHRTVRDNVALPLEIQAATKHDRYTIAERALAQVNLTGWGDHYCSALSGGMQQRVGLARALAADPSILLMDEPFSALDPLIRRQLQDEFINLSRTMGKTTVFITHDLDEAIRIGDRIAIMKDGAIVQVGTPEDIVTDPKDDYVAAFVANISRLHILSARSIMEAPDAYRRRNPAWNGSTGNPPVSAMTDLASLIDIATGNDEPILVSGTESETVGIIDRHSLLRAIRGETRL